MPDLLARPLGSGWLYPARRQLSSEASPKKKPVYVRHNDICPGRTRGLLHARPERLGRDRRRRNQRQKTVDPLRARTQEDQTAGGDGQPQGRAVRGTAADDPAGVQREPLRVGRHLADAREHAHRRDPAVACGARQRQRRHPKRGLRGRLAGRLHGQPPERTSTCTSATWRPARRCRWTSPKPAWSRSRGAGSALGYQSASEDGSTIFFLDDARLTKDSTAANGAPDLYVCEVEEAGGERACKLTDLTVVRQRRRTDATSRGGIPGSASDGHNVFFVANAVLSGGAQEARAATGSRRRSTKTKSWLRTCATSTCRHRTGFGSWSPPSWSRRSRSKTNPTGASAASASTSRQMTSRVSPNGEWFSFMSDRRLPTATNPAGYNNRDANSNRPDEEVFLYNAPAKSSCAPLATRPGRGRSASMTAANPAKASGSPSTAHRTGSASSLPRTSRAGPPDPTRPTTSRATCSTAAGCTSTPRRRWSRRM